jgi:hypothetical protein|tara:strand:- start:435 stop:719 length:285 start_codon:yes stop_codon:yes gene_type:complete
MDNIKDENLKRLGKYIAQEFINLARETTKTDWVETNVRDYSIGELARCVTLQNLYLDREEYEKCAIMKVRIMELQDRLNLPSDTDLTNLEDDEE